VIDLKARFGDRYKIVLDESASVDTDRETRLWCYRIPCRYGFISVWGEDTLAGYTDRARMISRLIAVPGVTVRRRGDTECRVIFPPRCSDAVADVLQARRRVRLSAEERERRAAWIQRVRPDPIKSTPPKAS
jgi:hypothetical protein